jgi:hypothetical protein
LPGKLGEGVDPVFSHKNMNYPSAAATGQALNPVGQIFLSAIVFIERRPIYR